MVNFVESSSLVWKIAESYVKLHKNRDPEILGRKKHLISEDGHKMSSLYNSDSIYKTYKIV